MVCRCLQMLRVLHAQQRLQHHHCLAFQSGVQTELKRMVLYPYQLDILAGSIPRRHILATSEPAVRNASLTPGRAMRARVRGVDLAHRVRMTGRVRWCSIFLYLTVQ
jgi:hypothetical protein